MSPGSRVACAIALLAIQPAMAAPDELRGQQIYTRCLACHALASDRVGPRHCGLFGRLAGSVPAFEYSSAMKKSAIVWNEETLDRFLAKPLRMVPGTTMTYDGVSEQKDRSDLIAYLKKAGKSSECKKK